MRSTCTALLFLVVAGCGCDGKRGPDPEAVARLDDHHTLAAPVTVGNLTVWPVLTDKPLDLGEFMTLDEALRKGAAEVREVGSEHRQIESSDPTVNLFGPNGQRAEAGSGSSGQTLDEPVQALSQVAIESGATVNTLVIENKGDLPILVCAGTIVKGGNQDRQIGQDFVLKAHSTTPVDAFCVEQGRWTSDRLGQETGGKFQVLEGMATAKVRAKGQYEKDQSGVWQEVAAVTTGEGQLAEQNASSSFAVAFDSNAAASAEDLKRIDDALKARFMTEKAAVGFAYSVNGKPVAVRTFAHPRLLAKHLDDFVRGMATEALLAKTDEPLRPADAQDVVALVKRISAAEEQVAATAGLNRNGLRTNEVGYNGSCYVSDKEGNLRPLTQDWTAK